MQNLKILEFETFVSQVSFTDMRVVLNYTIN